MMQGATQHILHLIKHAKRMNGRLLKVSDETCMIARCETSSSTQVICVLKRAIAYREYVEIKAKMDFGKSAVKPHTSYFANLNFIKD